MSATLPPATFTDQSAPPEPIECSGKRCETMLPWNWYDHQARCKARGVEPRRYRKPRWLQPAETCEPCQQRKQYDDAEAGFAHRQEVAGIPEIFRSLLLESAAWHGGGSADDFRRQHRGSTYGIVGGNSAAARALRGWKPSDGWVYIHGVVGSGKSSLACAVVNGVLRHPYPLPLAVIAEESWAAEILQASTDAKFRRERADRHDPVGRASEVDVLVYDDFATRSKDERKRTVVDDWLLDSQERLIDERYRSNRATILTSNRRLQDLDERFSKRLCGRIRERVGDRYYDLGNYDWRAL